MQYFYGLVLAIMLSGCAITWSGVALAVASAVSVAEDVGGIVKQYKDAKKYLQDRNTTKE